MQQLDIFADSESVQRTNDLIAALACFDYSTSRQAIHALVAADPCHEALDKFQVLSDFIEHWVEYIAESDYSDIAATIVAEEKLICEQIMPVAIVMGQKREVLVRTCWESLAKLSEQAGIDPKQTPCFAAELYLRAGKFHDVVRTAKVIPCADMRSAVQRWLALGYAGCGKTEHARSATLRFAWLSPQKFDAFVQNLNLASNGRPLLSFFAHYPAINSAQTPVFARASKSGIDLVIKL